MQEWQDFSIDSFHRGYRADWGMPYDEDKKRGENKISCVGDNLSSGGDIYEHRVNIHSGSGSGSNDSILI